MKRLIALIGLGSALISSYIHGCTTLDTKYSKQVDKKRVEQVVKEESPSVPVKPKIKSIDDVAKERFKSIPDDEYPEIANYAIAVACSPSSEMAMNKALDVARINLMLGIAAYVTSETIVKNSALERDIIKVVGRGVMKGIPSTNEYDSFTMSDEKREIAYNSFPYLRGEEEAGDKCAVAIAGFPGAETKANTVKNVTEAVEKLGRN